MDDVSRLENKDGGPTLAPRKRPRMDDPEEFAILRSVYLDQFDPTSNSDMFTERMDRQQHRMFNRNDSR